MRERAIGFCERKGETCNAFSPRLLLTVDSNEIKGITWKEQKSCNDSETGGLRMSSAGSGASEFNLSLLEVEILIGLIMDNDS